MKKLLTRVQVRPATALACAVAAAAGLVVMGYQHVLPPLQPKMVAGSTWLVSRSVGELTLVDGISAAVSASVPVAQPNAQFTVAIGDQRAYTVDPASGNVVQVSGATLEKAPMKPLSVQAQAMTVHPVGDAYFAVDPKNRVLQAMGAGTERLGEQERLPESVLAVASDGRRVWLADGRSGGLLSFEATASGPVQRELRDVYRRDATDLQILITGDQPVVVDRTHQTATLLTESGQIAATTPLPLEEKALVSATHEVGRVLVAEPSRGVVMSCGVQTGACGTSYPITGPNVDLGAVVEARGHAFALDNATNQVHVTDLAGGSVAVTEELLAKGVRVELSTRDGVVFFNDPNSEKAGVIDADGRVRRIDKYDPTKPPSASHSASSPPSRTSTTSKPSGATSGPRPSLTGSRGNRPDGTAGSLPLPTGSSSNAPDMPHINAINASPDSPEADEEVSFTADVTGAVPEKWTWEVRGPTGQVETSASTPRFSHRFGQPATYEVKLTIAAGSRGDERARNIVVVAAIPPAECGDTIRQNVRLRKDLTCTGTALTVAANDVVVDLAGHSITGSGDGVGVAVEQDRVNVTVRNGTIRSFRTGVALTRSNYSDIEQIRFESNTGYDMGCLGGIDMTVRESSLTKGIYCHSGADGLKFIGSTLVGVTARLGWSAPNVTFANCTITDSVFGFDKNSSGTVVDSTLLRSNIWTVQSGGLNVTRSRLTSSHVDIGASSDGATFRDNEFIGADAGVTANGGTGGRSMSFERNTFRDNNIGLNLAGAQLPLGALDGLRVTGNTFINNGVAGVFLETRAEGPSGHLIFSGNTFTSNGHRSNGTRDGAGRPVDDGLHINTQPGANVEIRDTTTRNNADHGIEAVPGTVVDAGGNTSTGDPAGCLGVVCG